MKLIYACFGGAHSSPVAAAIHLGWLPADRTPTAEELLAIPRFDRTRPKDHGLPEHMGRDEMGHDIYALGRGSDPLTVERALEAGYELAGGDTDELLFVSTLSCVNLAMRIGGFVSRALGWTALGRPIVIWGTRRAYGDLVQLVRETKHMLQECTALERN